MYLFSSCRLHFLCFQEVLQKLLKDPVIQQVRLRQEVEETNEEGLLTGELSGKSALKVGSLES